MLVTILRLTDSNHGPIVHTSALTDSTQRKTRMNLITVTVPELKAGNIVHFYGGTFRVLHDARRSDSHLPHDGIGPTDCAVAEAVCLAGEIKGYFRPGSNWTFQGNQLATHRIEM